MGGGMRRLFCGLVFSLALLGTSVSSQAQSTVQSPVPGIPPSVGSPDAIIDLLQQSHDLDTLLSPRMRAPLLRMQAQTAANVSPALALAWANELFQLSAQEKGR